MTPTAKELWNDIHFCRKRYWEQLRYMANLRLKRTCGDIRMTRYFELYESAKVITVRFLNRLKELQAKSL